MTSTLDDQIQSLLDGAPQDGQTPLLIEVITPLLKEIALQLKHTEYYILQNTEGRWMMTSLSHREDQQPDKTVIYAYATLEDAQLNPQVRLDRQVMALPTPVILILFQLLALQPVTSLLFFDTPGNRKDALEIRRNDIQNLVKTQLKLYQHAKANPIPSDLA